MVRLLFFSLWLATHPVHVSLMSIDYVQDQKLFNVFIRVYYDDFLIDSGIEPADHKNLVFSGNDEFTRKIISDYVNDRIILRVNNRQIEAELGNMDLSDNELRMNLFFGSTGRVNSITVKNLIMTSIYSDQANMIIVKVNDFEEGAKLTADETEKTFKIN
ncbi:MAG: hypothetical protein E4H43_00785 [Bacteroidia bacterium]|nr:MAG: hypothetical protein E4H43_00785 [Bacteroidia bacterium]